MNTTMLCRMCGKNILISLGQQEVTCGACGSHQGVVVAAHEVELHIKVPNPEEYYQQPRHVDHHLHGSPLG